MGRSKTAVAALAAVVLIAGGWYWSSPWWALWRTREAARAGDVTRLSEYVDFAKLTRQAQAEHQSLWHWLATVSPRDTADQRAQVANAKRKFAESGTLTVRPSDVRPWLSEMPVSFASLVGGGGNDEYRIYIEHRGLSEFRVRDRLSPVNGGVLTYRRHGFGWKLEAMQWGQQ